MPPITELPKSSIGILKSSQTLTHAPSLVKELIENSIDANATSISVEISQNLLDVIQVRDNGHGISPEGKDRDLVAKPHCTSKIQGLQDLNSVRSLGFRGEALSSAAVVGNLVITTRVDGEKTAVTLTINRNGEVISKKPTGAAIGTTVRVEKFLNTLPVRREIALKSLGKYMAEIRRLLVTYALANPGLRLSFRTIGGIKSCGPGQELWTYIPSKNVLEAVRKIFGNELPKNCIWRTSENSTDEGKIKVEGIFANPGTESSIICKKPLCRPYIFVDSRPISAARRGLFKDIVLLYRNYLKSSVSGTKLGAYTDPFIFLNFRCEPGTYDPNIEPAKDDIIFRDAESVMQVVNNLFAGIYGELPGKRHLTRTAAVGTVESTDFQHLLSETSRRTDKVGMQTVGEENELPPIAEAGKWEIPSAVRQRPPLDQAVLQALDSSAQLFEPEFASEREADSFGERLQAEQLMSDVTLSSMHRAHTPQSEGPSRWGFSVTSGDLSDEEPQLLRQTHSPQLTEEEIAAMNSDGARATNPWIIAKMNSSLSSLTGHPSSLRSSTVPTTPVAPKNSMLPAQCTPLAIEATERRLFNTISSPVASSSDSASNGTINKIPVIRVNARGTLTERDFEGEIGNGTEDNALQGSVQTKKRRISKDKHRLNSSLDQWLSSNASNAKIPLSKQWSEFKQTRWAPKTKSNTKKGDGVETSDFSAESTPPLSSTANEPFHTQVRAQPGQVIEQHSIAQLRGSINAMEAFSQVHQRSEREHIAGHTKSPSVQRQNTYVTPLVLQNPSSLPLSTRPSDRQAALTPHPISLQSALECSTLMRRVSPASESSKLRRKFSSKLPSPSGDIVKGLRLEMRIGMADLAQYTLRLSGEDLSEKSTRDEDIIGSLKEWLIKMGVSEVESHNVRLKWIGK